jgi:hypothetical protein
VEESVVGSMLLRLRGGHQATLSGGDLVFGEVQRVRTGCHLRMTQKVSVLGRGICLGDAPGHLPQPPHRRQGLSFLSLCDSSWLVLPTGSRIPQVFCPDPPPTVDVSPMHRSWHPFSISGSSSQGLPAAEGISDTGW